MDYIYSQLPKFGFCRKLPEIHIHDTLIMDIALDPEMDGKLTNQCYIDLHNLLFKWEYDSTINESGYVTYTFNRALDFLELMEKRRKSIG